MIEKLVSKRSWIAINAGILLCAAAVPSAVLAQTQTTAPTKSGTSSKAQTATGQTLHVSTTPATSPSTSTSTAPSSSTSGSTSGSGGVRGNCPGISQFPPSLPPPDSWTSVATPHEPGVIVPGSEKLVAGPGNTEIFSVDYTDEWPMDASDVLLQVNGVQYVFGAQAQAKGLGSDANPAIPDPNNHDDYTVSQSDPTNWSIDVGGGATLAVSGSWTWGHAGTLGVKGVNGNPATITFTSPKIPGATVNVMLFTRDGDHCGDWNFVPATFVNPIPTFSIAKDVQDAKGNSINGQTVATGSTLNYVVTLKNTSATVAGSPGTINDVISQIDPKLFTVVPPGPTVSDGTVATNSQGNWSWDLSKVTVPAQGTETLKVSVVVNSLGGEIDNSACLTGSACPPACPTTDGCPGPCTNVTQTTDAVTVCNFTPPPFSIAKKVLDASGADINGKLVPQGSQLNYTVTVTNNGTADGTPGKITDVISQIDSSLFTVVPPGTPSVSAGSVATNSKGNWTWDLSSVSIPKNGGTETLTVSVVVNSLGGEIDNSACLPGAANCPPPCPKADSCPGPCTNVTQTADAATVCNFTPPPFSIGKKVLDANGADINGKLVPQGTTLNYVVTVTNNGTAAGSPGKITDVISKINPSLYTIVPPGTPSVSDGTVSTNSQGNWTWDLSSVNIPVNGTETLKVSVTVNAQGGEIDNSACLPGSAACPPPCPTSSSCPGPCTSVQQTPEAATVCNFTPPAVTLAKCIVTTNDCVSSTQQAAGDTVTYKVTVTNPSSATAAIKNVVVDDLVSTPDSLPFIVNDGVNLNASNAPTTNSFQGSPVVSVTKVGDNHYQWTFASLDPGQSGVVTFTINIGTPAAPAAGTSKTFHVDNTASEPTFNPPAVTVHSTVPVSTGVQAVTTPATPAPAPAPTTPTTGSELNLRVASGFFVSGLFLILFGLVSRPRRRRTA